MNSIDKTCPKCGILFQCNSVEVSQCQCNIVLDEATLDFLKKTTYDCLCSQCLQHYDTLIKKSTQYQFPTQKNSFIEHTHYYLENGYWVFTELYHVLRGHCCKNNCRHCAYGFRK